MTTHPGTFLVNSFQLQTINPFVYCVCSLVWSWKAKFVVPLFALVFLTKHRRHWVHTALFKYSMANFLISFAIGKGPVLATNPSHPYMRPTPISQSKQQDIHLWRSQPRQKTPFSSVYVNILSQNKLRFGKILVYQLVSLLSNNWWEYWIARRKNSRCVIEKMQAWFLFWFDDLRDTLHLLHLPTHIHVDTSFGIPWTLIWTSGMSVENESFFSFPLDAHSLDNSEVEEMNHFCCFGLRRSWTLKIVLLQ